MADRTASSAAARPRALTVGLALLSMLACEGIETEPASWEVRESVEQLHITNAEPGVMLGVYHEKGGLQDSGETDHLGSLVFRLLEPGDGYFVRELEGAVREESGPHSVISVEASQPDPSFYANQVLQPGYNYITTRDGTTLSAYVYLPGPPENGPYPTLIGYSGYSPSKPGEPLSLPAELQPFVDALCATSLPVLCDAPSHPVGIIGGLFDFATVGVNIRGTGCSGGAFDYFETLQTLDGYDVVETIAAQPWVLNNKVGLAGLSYPGISQLFVAQTQPPSLASIAPLSVIADSTASVLAPGGIFNNGFAFEWTSQVISRAQPYGQGWEDDQVVAEAQEGITTCADNQLLHAQAVDAIEKALDNPWYDAALVDPVNPSSFVDQIEVPVFMSGAWQDEQTGPHWANLINAFTNSPFARFTGFNGLHPDGFAPQVLAEWKAFNDIYVGRRVPFASPLLLDTVAPEIFREAFGIALAFPDLPFTEFETVEEAQAAYEAQDRLRIIFESGVDDSLFPDDLGAPVGTFDTWFTQWPPAEVTPLRMYFNADGSLRETLPVEESSASAFAHDPEAGNRTLGGGQPFYAWSPTADDAAAVFVSAPLSQDTVMVGSASADLWVQSTAEIADLEVSLIEVRPDYKETYVQSGWLRTSHRTLREDATPLRPIKTHLESDASPLDPDAWNLARVEIFPFAHIFRAGSRLRIEVDTPGDTRERWRFLLEMYDRPVTHFVSHSEPHPSSVLLPVVPDIDVPTDLPPCPALRGQPCRDAEPYLNVLIDPAEVVEVADAGLDAVLREGLGIPALALTLDDLDDVVEVVANGTSVASLVGLEFASQLETLDVSGISLESLAPLVGLTALQQVSLDCSALDGESLSTHLPALEKRGVVVDCPEPAFAALQAGAVLVLFGLRLRRSAAHHR